MARLIDVDKVINSMQECIDENPDQKDSVAYFAFEALITALKQELTVDAVEVVHGRWEVIEPCDELYQCSACGEWVFVPEEHFAYCPYCGAKMDLEVKDA